MGSVARHFAAAKVPNPIPKLLRPKKSKFQILHQNLHQSWQLENRMLHLQFKNRWSIPKSYPAKGQKPIQDLKNQGDNWLLRRRKVIFLHSVLERVLEENASVRRPLTKTKIHCSSK